MFIFYVLHLRLFYAIKDLLTYILLLLKAWWVCLRFWLRTTQAFIG